MPSITSLVHHLDKLRRSCRLPGELLHPYPMLPILVWLIGGALPVALVVFDYAGIGGAILTGLGIACLAALLFGRVTWQYLALLLLGVGLALLQDWAPWRSYTHHLWRDAAYVQVEGIVVETALPESDELAWLSATSSLELAVRRLRLSDHEPWQACRGTILVRNLDMDVRYGQRLHLQGALKRPWQADLPGLFDYGKHLKVRGIEHLLYAENAIVLETQARGWRRFIAWLLRSREAVMQRILRGIETPANQTVLAAMTLGFRQGLTPEDRTVYLRSGMIHLFAISGLHVGILFSVLLTLLLAARLPFTVRYLLAPWLLLLYVLATGAAPSAVRAWLMITIWSMGRGCKLPVISVNAVLAAAFVLLVINPFYLFQTGFQFSFVIVLSLIWGWRQAQHFIHYLYEKRQWIPARHRGRDGWWQASGWFALKSFLSMLAAWLGGIGLSAIHNQLFLPTSVFSNMAVFTLAFAIIWLSSLKLILSFVFPWGLEPLVGWCLEGSLGLLRFLATFSSDYGGATPMPSPAVWAVLVYYVLLGAFLLSVNRLRRVMITGTLLITFTAAMVLWPRHDPASTRVTLLMPSGSIAPAILVQPSYRHRQPLLVNAGSRDLGYSLGDWLRLQGIGTLDAIVLTGNTREFYGGLSRLLEEVQVRSLVVAADNRRQKSQLETHAWQAQARWRYLYREPALTIQDLRIERSLTPETTELRLSWPTAAGLSQLHIFARDNLDCQVTYTPPGAPPQQWQFTYANHVRTLVIESE